MNVCVCVVQLHILDYSMGINSVWGHIQLQVVVVVLFFWAGVKAVVWTKQLDQDRLKRRVSVWFQVDSGAVCFRVLKANGPTTVFFDSGVISKAKLPINPLADSELKTIL